MKGFGEIDKSKKRNKSNFIKKYDDDQILNEAIKYHCEGNILKASKLYKFLINKGSKNSVPYANYGLILINSGKKEDAEKFIRKAIELNPKDSISYSNLGGILRDLGKLQEAEFCTRKAIELNPKDSISYSNLGGILRDLGKLQEAEFCTRKAIELNPKDSISYSNLGGILQDLGKLQEAEMFTRKAIELNPKDSVAYSNLGGILNDFEKLKEAEMFTRKAIELNPKDSVAYSNLGGILNDFEKLKEAEMFSRKAIELNPNFANSYSNLGSIARKNDKLEQAEMFTRKAIELNPNFAEAYSNLGGILMQLGNLKEAEIFARKAIELNLKFANAYSNLGLILYELGNLKEAEIFARKAIELNPNFAKAYYSLSKIEAISENSWEEHLFTKDILKNQKDIDKIDIYFARANILERKSNYIQSANVLKEANNLNRKLYGTNFIRIKDKLQYYYKISQKITIKKNLHQNQLKSIFIVGLPRSGKTITESILSRNKALLKCGEDKALSIAVDEFLNKKGTSNQKDMYQIFIENISRKISHESYICSTNPSNFLFTGLIASQIPKSKVIYCFRNPLDHVKEMYSHNINNKFTFRTSIIESAQIVLSINELMENYKSIFNSKIYFLNYDQLVLNQEKEIKSLVNWLGWEYKQKYLYPTLDSTTTINSFNNDSLINTKHLNTWKNYQELLKPAIETIHSKNKFSKLISSI